VVPKFDGTHLVIPDKVPDAVFKLRQHQLDGIYRGIVSPFMCAAHSVGAGKTALMICIAMMRKIRFIPKPAMVVPNHLIHQMASDIYRLFPSANVLAATAKDFEKKSRRRLISRIATGDYDLILIPHTSFEFAKLSDSKKFIFRRRN
jgi:N12 class adenine-specific DNA methylase